MAGDFESRLFSMPLSRVDDTFFAGEFVGFGRGYSYPFEERTEATEVKAAKQAKAAKEAKEGAHHATESSSRTGHGM